MPLNPMPSYELYKAHIRAGHDFVVLGHHSKKPLHYNWTHRRNAQGAEWYMKRGYNLGVRLRPTDLVLDVDYKRFPIVGDYKKNSLAELQRCIDFDLSCAPRVRTGSGGLHIYLRKPPDLKVVAEHGLFRGIEYKTAGHQVLACGSVHPVTKNHYDIHPHPFVDELWMALDAPAALLKLIARPIVQYDGVTHGMHTPEQLASMLRGIDPLDFRGQEKWLTFMMACHHATAGEGAEEFIDWSTNDPLYSDRSCDIRRRWNSLDLEKTQVVSYKTLYKELHKRNKSHLIPPSTTAEDDFGAVDADDLGPYAQE